MRHNIRDSEAPSRHASIAPGLSAHLPRVRNLVQQPSTPGVEVVIELKYALRRLEPARAAARVLCHALTPVSVVQVSVRLDEPELEPGERAVISRVRDTDPDMLAYLGELGMYPGTPIELIDRSRFGGPFRVKVSGKSHFVGVELAETVYVKIKARMK